MACKLTTSGRFEGFEPARQIPCRQFGIGVSWEADRKCYSASQDLGICLLVAMGQRVGNKNLPHVPLGQKSLLTKLL